MGLYRGYIGVMLGSRVKVLGPAYGLGFRV